MMSNQQEPNHDSLLARIDELAAEALGLIERSDLDPRMRHALKLVAEGQLSYRAIARECGYRSPGSIQRAAQRFGLLTVHEVRRQQLPEVRRVEAFRKTREELQNRDTELWNQLVVGPRSTPS